MARFCGRGAQTPQNWFFVASSGFEEVAEGGRDQVIIVAKVVVLR